MHVGFVFLRNVGGNLYRTPRSKLSSMRSPDLESGNMLAKQPEYLAEAEGGRRGPWCPRANYSDKPCLLSKDTTGICSGGSATCATPAAGVPLPRGVSEKNQSFTLRRWSSGLRRRFGVTRDANSLSDRV